jgi:hypothetical protein
LIYGRFGDTSGRPYLEAKIAIPHQNVWRYCPMIIDTGAERSVLMPIDARLMGLDRSALDRRAYSEGIGGHCDGFDLFAYVVLLDEEAHLLHNFNVTLFVPDESPDLYNIDSSILGRDVLDRVRFSYSKPDGIVSLAVAFDDGKFDVRGWDSPRLAIR